MKRKDGRTNDKLRKIIVKKDYIKFAEGSCLIELGNTKVVCTASIEESVPGFLRDSGTGWITAEYGMIPRSCKSRVIRESSKGKKSGRTYEIQRLIGRSLRTGVDLKELGERTIWIDCDVIQADGGTRTASISGSFIALCLALKKLKKDGLLDKVPLKDYVGATSVGIIDGEPILDLTYDEDSSADVDMNVVMTQKGKFIEIQGTAEKIPFDKKQLNGLIELATKGIKQIIRAQKSSIGAL